MDKVDSMHEQMGNVSRGIQILRKDNKKTIKEMRIPLMSLLVDWTKLRKESQSYRICQQNP